MARGADPIKLQAFIQNAGLSYRLGAKSYIFTCPLCRKERRLYISRTTGRFVCFYCREDPDRLFQGAPEFALKELTGRSVADIRASLYGPDEVPAGAFLDIRFHDFMEDDEVDVDLEDAEAADLPDLVWPYHCYPLDHPWAAQGVAYLEGRGVPAEVAAEYDIRYSTVERSVAFPVWVGERLVGWQMRTIDPEEVLLDTGEVAKRIKIISSDDIPRDHCVMFSNRIGEHAVLCEGPVDALKAHLVGGNVATMGKAVSQGQVELLLRAGIRKLYLALDPDAAADIEPLLWKFEDIEAFKVILPAKYKDLGAMPLEEARDCILGAKPLKKGRIHIYFPSALLRGLAL